MPDKVRASSEFILWLKGYCQKNNLTSEKALDQMLAKYRETNQPEVAPAPVHDLEHLNIDKKDGVIQNYMSKRAAQLEQRRDRIAEAYLTEQARQKAKIEGEAARAEIHKETENEKRFTKQYIRSGKPKVDWGDSEYAGEPDWSYGYR